MSAESEDELHEWLTVLNLVKGKTEEEINEMMAQALVNPRHSEGTVEVDDILSVGPTSSEDVDGHPSFVVMTSERVYKVRFLRPSARALPSHLAMSL
jgi:myosin X